MAGRITAGMYALDTSLEHAWKRLFKYVAEHSPSLALPDNVVFTDSLELALDSSTRLAHVCGYPLMTQLKSYLRPLCVPCFDIRGCENGQYYSVFLVRNNDEAQQLSECKGYRAGVNSSNSNSGMNVFRAAVAQERTPSDNAYFSSVKLTGSHVNSMQAIANEDIDIASIDVITFHFVSRLLPELGAKLKVIGRSASTMGLPFVTHCDTALSGESLTLSLNDALKTISDDIRALNLRNFRTVQLQDYQSILDLEANARELAYPDLI